eukprot:GSChrysophyteH1.ASY1.ANO1.2462.1 assembled CDS
MSAEFGKDKQLMHTTPPRQSRKSAISEAEPVKVFLRIRPEFFNKQKVLLALDDKTVRLTIPEGHNASKRKAVEAVDDKIFSFDRIFDDDSCQEELYKEISAHVNATVRGYNTTVFAYGSTGSGKTYTMTGNSSAPGIIPRAISEIFSIVEATAAREKDVFFYVRLSYVELYNNTFRNLLEQASNELAAKEAEAAVQLAADEGQDPGASTTESTGAGKGTTLSPTYLRIPVITAQEAFQLINKGNKNRATGSTQCNDFSSRSHAILTLHVESRVAAGTRLGAVLINPAQPELRLGKMHLVDLAGSERLNMSGAEGETLLETQSINLSLTALGDVLSALSRNASILARVPYRNSKLTHLLKDSLGGNSKTIMISTVRSSALYFQQTAVSLMYASRAKKIERLKSRLDARTQDEKVQLEAQMKNIITSQAGQLQHQREKITALQADLKQELTLSQNRIAEQEKEIEWLKNALDESSNAVANAIPMEQLERMQKVVDAWQAQAESTQKELVFAHNQMETLRQSNTTFSQEIAALQSSKQELMDQMSSTYSDKTSQQVQMLEIQCAELEKENLENKKAYSQTLSLLEGKSSSTIEGAMRRVQEINGMLEAESERANKAEEELKELKTNNAQKASEENQAAATKKLNEMQKSLEDAEKEHHEAISGIHSEHLAKQEEVRNHLQKTEDAIRAQLVSENERRSHELKAAGAKHEQEMIVARQEHQNELNSLIASKEITFKTTEEERKVAILKLEDELRTAVTSLADVVNEKQAAADSHEEKVAKLEDELRTAVTSLADVVNEKQAAADSHEEKVAKLEDELRTAVTSLADVVNEKQAAADNHEEKVAKLEDELRTAVTSLADVVNEKQAAADSHEEKVTELHGLMEGLQKSKEQLEEQMNLSIRHKSDQQEQYAMIQDEHKAHIEKLRIEYEGSLADHQKTIDDAAKSVKKNEEEIEMLQKQLHKSLDTGKATAAELVELQEEHEKRLEGLRNAHESDQIKWDEDIKLLQLRLSGSTAMVADLKAELASAERAKSDAELLLQKTRDESKEKLETEAATNLQLAEECASLRKVQLSTQSELSVQLESKTETVKALERQCEALEGSLSKLEGKYSALTIELDQATTKSAQLETEAKLHRSKYADRETNLEKQIGALQTMYNNIEAEKAKIEQELQDSKAQEAEKVGDIEATLSKVRESNIHLEKKVASLESSRNELEMNCQSLQKEIQNVPKQIKQIQATHTASLKSLENAHHAYSTEQEKRMQEYRERAALAEKGLQAQIADLLSSNEELSSQLRESQSAAKQEHGSLLSEQLNATKAASAEADRLREELATLRVAHEELLGETCESISHLREEKELLTSKLAKATASIEEAEAANHKESVRLNALEKQHNDQIEVMRREHADAAATAEATFQGRLEGNSAMSSKLIKKLEEDKEQMQQQLDARLQQIEQTKHMHKMLSDSVLESETSFNSKIETLKKQHLADLNEKQKQLETAQHRLSEVEEARKRDLASVREDYTKVLKDMQVAATTHQNHLDNQTRAQIKAVEEQFLEEKQRFLSKERDYEEQLEREKAEAGSSLRSAEEVTMEHEELESTKRLIAELEIQRNKELTTHRELLASTSRDSESLKQELAKTRSEASAAQTALQVKHKELEEELSKRLEQFQQERDRVAGMEMQLKALRQAHETEVESLKKVHQDSENQALLQQEETLRQHLLKESERIVNEHENDLEVLRTSNAVEIEALTEALRKAEWQVKVTMKCLTDMSHQRKFLHEKAGKTGFSIEDLREVLREHESQYENRRNEIAEGHTPQSLKGTPQSIHVDMISPVLSNGTPTDKTLTPIEKSDGANVSTELDNVPQTPFRLEPSATGYSPEILSHIDHEEVQKINIANRDSGGSNGRNIDQFGESDLEIIRSGSTAKKFDGGNLSSIALRSSADELIAAILDGDVQGLHNIVLSRGESLSSDAWKEIMPSVLPLHRAIAGLHYHGSERLLIDMIDSLSSLGANMNAVDNTGNTCLHKAIQLCTSKSVVSVVASLLVHGVDFNARSDDGMTALHCECYHVRTASVYVISALIEAGADPKAVYNSDGSKDISSLTLVLQRGAAASAVASGTATLRQTGLHHRSRPTDELYMKDESGVEDGESSTRIGSRRVWVKAAKALVVAGGTDIWDAQWADPKNQTQLHLLLSAFPPAQEDARAYQFLVDSALNAGCKPDRKDSYGRTAFYILCKRLSSTPASAFRDSASLISLLLRFCPSGTVLESSRDGETALDLLENVPENGIRDSCLLEVKRLLIDAAANRHNSSTRSRVNASRDGLSIRSNNGALKPSGFVPGNTSASHRPRTTLGVDENASSGNQQQSNMMNKLSGVNKALHPNANAPKCSPQPDLTKHHTLLEEAENERMHLLTYVMTPLLWIIYTTNPKAMHRFVGYLEETACETYSNIIRQVETPGTPLHQEWANLPAPDIAKGYWHLKEEAMWLDVLKCIFADEAHHRDVNHTFASMESDDPGPFVEKHLQDAALAWRLGDAAKMGSSY